MMCFKDGEYIGIIIMILLERNIWSFLQTYIQDELNEDINQIQRDLFTNASSHHINVHKVTSLNWQNTLIKLFLLV